MKKIDKKIVAREGTQVALSKAQAKKMAMQNGKTVTGSQADPVNTEPDVQVTSGIGR